MASKKLWIVSILNSHGVRMHYASEEPKRAIDAALKLVASEEKRRELRLFAAGVLEGQYSSCSSLCSGDQGFQLAPAEVL